MNKVVELSEAAAMIHDGQTVALQAMATQACPMAFVRELIRQDRRDLTLVCLVGGIGVDWLAHSGAISRFIGAAVTMEQFGLCQQYRQAVESGRIRVEELSESALLARLTAGARNLPFLPIRGLLGTDLIDINPNLVRFKDPFEGETLVGCRALVPDVAVVHAHRADMHGNVQCDPTLLWPDIGLFPKAAARTIVTVEEIVDTEILRRNPDRTILPGFRVDAVVQVPFGAHPTSLYPRYTYDEPFHRAWTAVSRDSEAARSFLQPYLDAGSQDEYLALVGSTSHIELESARDC